MAVARLLDIASQLLSQADVPVDRLPYTEAFEVIYRRFLEMYGRDISRHDVWWSFLDARKRGRGRASRRRRSSVNP